MTIGIDSIPLRLETHHLRANEVSALSSDRLPVRNSTGSSKIRVEARHLCKSYGDHLAVNNVSFSIDGGAVLGLLGPNGAGKSTSMLMLAGLLDPSSGDVLLNGEKYDGRNLEQRRRIGIVPQEYAIYEELSAVDNLAFFGKLYGLRGKALKSRCDEVLAEMGLSESARRPASQFSGGMKRRLNFGIALMHKPEVLILDEPTLGVDPQSRTRLMDCIRRQTATGGCVIYASHYMEEAQAICQQVVILDHGRVLKNDSIQQLLEGLAADIYIYVSHTTGIVDELGDLVRVEAGIDNDPAVIVSGNSPLVKAEVETLRSRSELLSPSTAGTCEPAADLGSKLQMTLGKLKKLGIQVLRIETQQSNLEHLFLQLTGKKLRD